MLAPKVEERTKLKDSPLINMTLDERTQHPLMLYKVFFINTTEPIDFDSLAEGNALYLYGVQIHSIHEIKEGEGYYNGDYTYIVSIVETESIDATVAKTVISSHENVEDISSITKYGCGDIDADGEITSFDYLLLKRIYFETYYPTVEEIGYADMDRDGVITTFDYVCLKRYYYGTLDFSIFEYDEHR